MVERIPLNKKRTSSSTTKDYPVGYGKPPKEHQFKRGVCPNPGGIPRKRSSMKDDLVEELNEVVTVDGEDVTKLRAWIKSLVTDAPRNVRASTQLLSLYMQLGLEPEVEEKSHELANDDKARLDEIFLKGLTGLSNTTLGREMILKKIKAPQNKEDNEND